MTVHIEISYKPRNVDTPMRKVYRVGMDWQIREGYVEKNWDRRERPILVVGSAFDANSLGKWIYDWTIFCHGPKAPITDMAGELWQLLITLMIRERTIRYNEACRKSVAEEYAVGRIARGMERLWSRLEGIVEECEEAMRRCSKQMRSGEVYLDSDGGATFVDTMFGRDDQLEAIEQLMTDIRSWKVQVDGECIQMMKERGTAVTPGVESIPRVMIQGGGLESK